MKNEKGFALLEAITGLGLLGIVAVFFLSTIGTATQATVIADKQVTAESVARSQIEYIKACDYEYTAIEYPVDPALDVAGGWSIADLTVESLHCSDYGIQEVTFTVKHNGETKLTAETYKVDR